MRSVLPADMRAKDDPSREMEQLDDWHHALRSTVLSAAKRRRHKPVRMPVFNLPPMPEEFK